MMNESRSGDGRGSARSAVATVVISLLASLLGCESVSANYMNHQLAEPYGSSASFNAAGRKNEDLPNVSANAAHSRLAESYARR